MCAFVKVFADIPSSEGDWKRLEAGYILLTSVTTSEIEKDGFSPQPTGRDQAKTYQPGLRGLCSTRISQQIGNPGIIGHTCPSKILQFFSEELGNLCF